MFATEEVASQIVGFQNKTIEFGLDEDEQPLEDGYKFLTATFRKIEGTATVLNDFQMCEEATSGECMLQRMDYAGEYTDSFDWVTKFDCENEYDLPCPAGLIGVWAVAKYERVWNEKKERWEQKFVGYREPTEEEATVYDGEMLQLFALADYKVTFSGQVSDENIVFTFDFAEDSEIAEEEITDGFRFLGNAFPDDMNINNGFQMCTEAASGECNIQILDDFAEYSATYDWVTKFDCENEYDLPCPEGANGIWAVAMYERVWNEKKERWEQKFVGYRELTAEERTLKAGEGLQVFALQDYTCTVLCPYDL